MTRLDYKKLNETVRYAMWSVFRVNDVPEDREEVLKDFQDFLASYEDQDLVIRGVYDLGGIRAEADLMIWWHAEDIRDLQKAYRSFLKDTVLGRCSEPYWSEAALHRPAEFNKSHLPSFIMGEDPGDWAAVYPFVRSYDWYLIPTEDRRRILAEHGMAARDYPDVRANTVPAFALGDYEWILCFEGPHLDRIVDLMHKMRYTEARNYVREETPFFTGPRVNGSAEKLEAFINSLR